MKFFAGWYAMNDEYILGPIYDALKINGPKSFIHQLFTVKHNSKIERFWRHQE